MSKTLIATSTAGSMGPMPGSSDQQCLVRTSLGKLVCFYRQGYPYTIVYKTSDDEGVTWSAETLVVSSADLVTNPPYGFSVWVDTNDDILFICENGNARIYFRKLTYTSGTWTLGSVVIVSSAENYRAPIICRHSDGAIWIAAANTGNNKLGAFSSTNEGVSWTDRTLTATAFTNFYSVGIISRGTDIWVFGSFRKTASPRYGLVLFKYTGSWDAGTILFVTTSFVAAGTSAISVVKISDNYIWCSIEYVDMGTYEASLLLFKYDGSTWDSGEYLSSTFYPRASLCAVEGQPTIAWSGGDLCYRQYDGTSWGITQTLSTEPDGCVVNTLMIASELCIVWGTPEPNVAPYSLYFQKIPAAPPPVQQNIDSDSSIKVLGVQQTLDSESKVVTRIDDETIESDSYTVTRPSHTINSNANVFQGGICHIDSESKIITAHVQNTIDSDGKVVTQVQEAILSDGKIVNRITQTLISNAKVVVRQTVTLQSASSIRGSKIFYGQLKALVETVKNFYTQLTVTQLTPLDPTGLTTTDLKTGEALSLTWTDTGNYGYNIYKDVGGVWTLLNSLPVNGTSYISGNLVTGVTYSFKVKGVNGQGDESSGVTTTGTPTFDITRYKNPIFQIYIGGSLQTDAVLSSVEMTYGPSFSTANFFIPKRPDTVGLTPARQSVQVFINSTLVFTGYLVKREDVYTATDLRINLMAVNELWKYTWTTPEENFNKPRGSYQPFTNTIEVLRSVDAPTEGLPSVTIYSEVAIADMTTLEIMESMTRLAGNYQIYCSPSGDVSFYKSGAPMITRGYQIGKHIVDERLSTDISDKVDQVTVYSQEKQLTTYTDFRMGQTINSYSDEDIYEDKSEFFHNYIQDYLDRQSVRTVAGSITQLVWSLENDLNYDTVPKYVQDKNGALYIIFKIHLGFGTDRHNLSNIQILANVNQDVQINEYAYFTTLQGAPTVPIGILPSHVGLTTWGDSSVRPKNAIKSYKTFNPVYQPITAQIAYSQDGKSANIVIPTLPVRYSPNIRHKTATFVQGEGEMRSIPVVYADTPNQYVADLRVLYTYQFTEMKHTEGSGTVTRSYHDGVTPFSENLPGGQSSSVGRIHSNLDDVTDYLSDKAEASFQKLSHDAVRGSMTVLGDETLDLRTHVNGLEVMRVVHDFSNGYVCHLDLTEPQFYYGEAVLEQHYTLKVNNQISEVTSEIHVVDYNKNWVRYLSGVLGKDTLPDDPGTNIAAYSD